MHINKTFVFFLSGIKIEYIGWGLSGRPIELKTITTIGKKQIVTFPAVDAKYIMIRILGAKGSSWLSKVEAYLIDEKLIEK